MITELNTRFDAAFPTSSPISSRISVYPVRSVFGV